MQWRMEMTGLMRIGLESVYLGHTEYLKLSSIAWVSAGQLQRYLLTTCARNMIPEMTSALYLILAYFP